MTGLIRGVSPALLSALVASLLLAGCGVGDADSTPTFSPSTSTSATSTSASSVSPSSSATEVQETPEAFVRRWNQASTEMQNSGDTSAYRDLGPDCKACRDVADTVDRYYQAGGFVRTKGWSMNSVTCKASGALKATCVAEVKNSPTIVKESASASEQRLHGGLFSEYFEMSLQSDAWQMTYIAQQAT